MGGIKMKIIRYSFNGFLPQQQSFHLEHEVYYHRNIFNINDFPEFLRPSIWETHVQLLKFHNENFELLQSGVWAFIDGCKNSQSLNHLKRRTPCWEAEIDDDTVVVGVNWNHLMKVSDSESKIFGFFIPEQHMGSIRNVKQR